MIEKTNNLNQLEPKDIKKDIFDDTIKQINTNKNIKIDNSTLNSRNSENLNNFNIKQSPLAENSKYKEFSNFKFNSGKNEDNKFLIKENNLNENISNLSEKGIQTEETGIYFDSLYAMNDDFMKFKEQFVFKFARNQPDILRKLLKKHHSSVNKSLKIDPKYKIVKKIKKEKKEIDEKNAKKVEKSPNFNRFQSEFDKNEIKSSLFDSDFSRNQSKNLSARNDHTVSDSNHIKDRSEDKNNNHNINYPTDTIVNRARNQSKLFNKDSIIESIFDINLLEEKINKKELNTSKIINTPPLNVINNSLQKDELYDKQLNQKRKNDGFNSFFKEYKQSNPKNEEVILLGNELGCES